MESPRNRFIPLAALALYVEPRVRPEFFQERGGFLLVSQRFIVDVNEFGNYCSGVIARKYAVDWIIVSSDPLLRFVREFLRMIFTRSLRSKHDPGRVIPPAIHIHDKSMASQLPVVLASLLSDPAKRKEASESLVVPGVNKILVL